MPFYNTFIESPEIKKFSNVELLKELPCYDELSIVKNDSAFSGYTRSYKVEIVDKRDPLVQLKASKQNIIDLFKDRLNEGFKYRLILNEYNYCRKIKRKYFCKNLIMSAEKK